jgi:hypothetical protein
VVEKLTLLHRQGLLALFKKHLEVSDPVAINRKIQLLLKKQA